VVLTDVGLIARPPLIRADVLAAEVMRFRLHEGKAHYKKVGRVNGQQAYREHHILEVISLWVLLRANSPL